MANFCYLGKKYHTSGHFPKVGEKAPNFTLTKTDLGEVHLSDLKGKKLILNIFPSIDTETCAASVQAFNKLSPQCKNFDIYGVSIDLPFAQDRFCKKKHIKNITCTSAFRHPEFGQNYGVHITSGPLEGLFARSVVAIDENGRVIFTQLVEELSDEPDYQALIEALK